LYKEKTWVPLALASGVDALSATWTFAVTLNKRTIESAWDIRISFRQVVSYTKFMPPAVMTHSGLSELHRAG
jgi:hypothetical protein